MREAVAALPVKYRAPLVLAYFQELGYAEIGEILGIERGHVAVLVFRARRQLRQMLSAPDRGEPMKCPDEPTLMMLADDELGGPAAAAVQAHAGRCSSCGPMLTHLRSERRALVEALREVALDDAVAVSAATGRTAAPAASGGRWWELGSLAAAVCAVVVVAAAAAGAASIWLGSLPLDWINPFHPSGRLTWLFTGTTLGLAAPPERRRARDVGELNQPGGYGAAPDARRAGRCASIAFGWP